jgi:hypothetical protein
MWGSPLTSPSSELKMASTTWPSWWRKMYSTCSDASISWTPSSRWLASTRSAFAAFSGVAVTDIMTIVWGVVPSLDGFGGGLGLIPSLGAAMAAMPTVSSSKHFVIIGIIMTPHFFSSEHWMDCMGARVAGPNQKKECFKPVMTIPPFVGCSEPTRTDERPLFSDIDGQPIQRNFGILGTKKASYRTGSNFFAADKVARRLGFRAPGRLLHVFLATYTRVVSEREVRHVQLLDAEALGRLAKG